MRREINLMTRGTGDCKIAGPEYQIRFDTRKEAQEIADEYYKKFDLVKKPRIRISNYHTSRLNGTANVYSGVIHLRNVGANVGVLIHELAHFEKNSHKRAQDTGGFTRSRSGRLMRKKRDVHGPTFKHAHTEMLLYWRNHLEKKYNITGSQKKVADDITTLTQKPLPKHYVRFGHGEKVHFKSKSGKIVKGFVKRINRRTVTVVEPDAMFGERWRVSPGMLKEGWPETVSIERLGVKVHEAPIEPVEDTEEENRDMITGLMDSLSKYAVHGTLSMPGIVRAFHANGVKNTDENRKIAVDYIKNELNLSIR